MKRVSFFSRQDRLRRITRRLLFLSTIGSRGVGTLGGVAAALAHYEMSHSSNVELDLAELIPAFSLGALVSLVASTLVVLFQWLRLNLSGTAVKKFFRARDLGQTDYTPAPNDRNLLNVVEEMAIAATVPTPRVFLPDEGSSINAFALVHRGESSIVGVTAGARDKLSRDELQARVGHDIGHIGNGDAAIKFRLLSLLQGFRWFYDASVAAIGWPFRVFESFKFAFCLTFYRTVVFGALYVLGPLRVGVARLMQAAIARRREYLADASSVQFTRFTAGLIAAPQKAGTYQQSRRRHPTKAAAFIMFVSPYRARSWLLRTHRTIEDRVEAASAMTLGIRHDDSGEDTLAYSCAIA